MRKAYEASESRTVLLDLPYMKAGEVLTRVLTPNL